MLSVRHARWLAAHVAGLTLVETHSLQMWMAYPLMPLYPEISMSNIFAGKVEVGVLTMIQTCDNSAGSADGQSADPFGTRDQDLFWDLLALPHSHSAGSLRSAHAGHAGHDSHFLFVWLPIRHRRAR